MHASSHSQPAWPAGPSSASSPHRHPTPSHLPSPPADQQCRLAGAQRMSYPPVVGGGPDACTIHYSRNDKRVPGGQLVLMDAGCELWGYASDVTRTWPVGGRYSGAQREVYQRVLEVRVFERAGGCAWGLGEPQQHTCRVQCTCSAWEKGCHWGVSTAHAKDQ